MSGMIKTYWFRSRTIWFAILHGMPALTLSILQYLGSVDLAPVLGSKTAAAVSIYLMVAVIILRAVTTKPMVQK